MNDDQVLLAAIVTSREEGASPLQDKRRKGLKEHQQSKLDKNFVQKHPDEDQTK